MTLSVNGHVRVRSGYHSNPAAAAAPLKKKARLRHFSATDLKRVVLVDNAFAVKSLKNTFAFTFLPVPPRPHSSGVTPWPDANRAARSYKRSRFLQASGES